MKAVFYFFSPKPGAKIVLSTAKMITIATPPVTTVVTILLTVLRTASLEMSATVTGFQMQVKRFITRKTTIVAAKWHSACFRTGPLLLNVTFL